MIPFKSKPENDLDINDFYLTLHGRILRDHLSIKQEKTPLSIIDIQLYMSGGGRQCSLAGCINGSGSYPLPACRGSYEVGIWECIQREDVILSL